MAADPQPPQISVHRIPVGSGIGALLAIAIIIAAMVVALPELRLPFVGGAGCGVLLALALIVWRRRRV